MVSFISPSSTWQRRISAEDRETYGAANSKGKRREQVRLRADSPQKRTAQRGQREMTVATYRVF